MNSAKGVIDEIFVDDGITKARVLIDGNPTAVSLLLLRNARVGDEILIGSGIALSVSDSQISKRNDYVFGNSR